MDKVQTFLSHEHSSALSDQSLARSDIFEYPKTMTLRDWLYTLPGSAALRTATRVVGALTRGEIRSPLEIVPETITPAIQAFLDSLRNATTTKEVSITRIQSGENQGTYIDLTPRELTQRIGLPIPVIKDIDEDQVPEGVEKMLYSAFSSLRGWEVITTKTDGTKRSHIRFFQRNR